MDLVKLHGFSTTHNKMKKLLKNIFAGELSHDNLVEGVYAHQYLETSRTRRQIQEKYKQRWPQPDSGPTPSTHPWLFDPCNPPNGWLYDPYYEIWIETK